MDTFSKLIFSSMGFLFLGIIILIVQAIRHKKKILGGICLLLAILSFGGACVSGLYFDGGAPSIMINAEDELEVAVNEDIGIYCLINYKDVKGVYADVTSIEKDGDYYQVYGKVTVNDLYDEKYYAKFEGTYRLSGNEFVKVELSMETPRKN